ncbi:MAG: YdcF family protein [Bdellovibrionales bacterium]
MSKSKSQLLDDDEIRRQRRRRILRWFTVVCFIAAGVGRIWQEWKLISAEFKPFQVRSTTVDCGVVLTGSAGRVREGFDLLEQGFVQKLIISGVNPQNTLRDLVPLWPYYPKVTEDTVLLEKRSETTYGNAVQSLPLVQALKCRDVLLITSELHMFRSYQTFRPVYPDTLFIYKHPVITTRGNFSVLDQALEVVKSLFYRPWAY